MEVNERMHYEKLSPWYMIKAENQNFYRIELCILPQNVSHSLSKMHFPCITHPFVFTKKDFCDAYGLLMGDTAIKINSLVSIKKNNLEWKRSNSDI